MVPPPELKRLDLQGPAKNINLRIDDISRRMVSNVPDLLLDLLEVAAYVYCADQQARRGSDKLSGYGMDWRRQMHFTIPVRALDLWSRHDVCETLSEALGFLSEDYYSFDFVPAQAPAVERETYFPELSDTEFAADEVALFSGGLDSFAGAAGAAADGKSIVLVGHHSSDKVFSIQRNLAHRLRSRSPGSRILYVPVNVTNSGREAAEATQRTRSFLFASLGIVIARMFGKDEISFYENGVVSLNIPIAGDVVGARATRTTHPKVIAGFEAVFSAILCRDIAVRAPFRWLTKSDVIRKIAEYGFSDLLSATNSCAAPRAMSKAHPHCGACSQCIDRRFAILAAGHGEAEPPGSYGIDLLTGDRSHERHVRMAAAYVKFFRDFANTTREQFIKIYPEITSALNHYPDTTPEEALARIHSMYSRHHVDVMTVIERALLENSAELARGELPPGCLLSMVFHRGRIEIAEPADRPQDAQAFMDRLSAPVCDFAVDESAHQIRFRGDLVLEGKNFEVFMALLPAFREGKAKGTEVVFMRSPDLALKLAMTDVSLRQRVGRLREVLTEQLAVGQGLPFNVDDVIENQVGKGYRINAQLRELSLGDLLQRN